MRYLTRAVLARTVTDGEFFWSHCQEPYGSTCWEWTGRIQLGYGVHYFDGHNDSAHRIAWSLANERAIPAGWWVLLRCDNAKCVRPSHLYLGTPTNNARDREMNKRPAGRRVRRRQLREAESRRRISFAWGATP